MRNWKHSPLIHFLLGPDVFQTFAHFQGINVYHDWSSLSSSPPVCLALWTSQGCNVVVLKIADWWYLLYPNWNFGSSSCKYRCFPKHPVFIYNIYFYKKKNKSFNLDTTGTINPLFLILQNYKITTLWSPKHETHRRRRRRAGPVAIEPLFPWK